MPEIKKAPTPKIICDRSYVLNELDIPSKYYIDRGFSKDVLIKHDIGYCTKKGLMYKRNVIPVYNHFFTGMIGCSGRSSSDKHKTRWLHSKGFPRNVSLYNSWFAEPYIKNTETIYITESPAKVWRMEEAGYFNTVGIFGTSLTLNQKKIISRMGAKNVFILMDSDEAGINASNIIANDLKNLYNVKVLLSPFVDLDETPVKEVSDFIGDNGA